MNFKLEALTYSGESFDHPKWCPLPAWAEKLWDCGKTLASLLSHKNQNLTIALSVSDRSYACALFAAGFASEYVQHQSFHSLKEGDFVVVFEPNKTYGFIAQFLGYASSDRSYAPSDRSYSPSDRICIQYTSLNDKSSSSSKNIWPIKKRRLKTKKTKLSFEKYSGIVAECFDHKTAFLLEDANIFIAVIGPQEKIEKELNEKIFRIRNTQDEESSGSLKQFLPRHQIAFSPYSKAEKLIELASHSPLAIVFDSMSSYSRSKRYFPSSTHAIILDRSSLSFVLDHEKLQDLYHHRKDDLNIGEWPDLEGTGLELLGFVQP